MIDIHTHILPYVDDGSQSFDESIHIIEGLIEQGVEHLFLTPHFYKQRNYLSTSENNMKIFKELQEKTKDLNISLYLGNEVKYSLEVFKCIEDGTIRPLNGCYYLIEFSTGISIFDIYEAVHNMLSKGYKPILAHIERYEHLSDLNDVNQLRKMGALVQINVSALLGNYGKPARKRILKLLKHDLVDFVATDSHRYHKNHFRKGYEFVCKKYSQNQADRIFNNQIII